MLPTNQPHETSMRVMVVSTDRRFREVASLLLERRGCTVSLGEGAGTLAERVDRDRIEVVIIDAGQSLATAARMTAAVQAVSRPVGVVVVGDETHNKLIRLQAIAKWGSFERLFEAVKQSHSERGRRTRLFERTTKGARI
jgi:DNA-binding NtrC family response regulator